MKIKERDMEDAPVVEHNCIKQSFEREKHLSGPEDITCLKPSQEQLDAYSDDTDRNIEKRTQKLAQTRK